MAQQRIEKPRPRSIFSLEAGDELDEILAEGFPIYQNGVEIDRFYPLKQPPIDRDSLDEKARRVLDLFGVFSDLNWEETEADLERIDRESTSSPPLDDRDW
jgi:hypothetical protein